MYIYILFIVFLSSIVVITLINYNTEIENNSKNIISDITINRYRTLNLIEFLPKSYVISVYYDDRFKALRLICVYDKDQLPKIPCKLKYDNNNDVINCKPIVKSYIINTQPQAHFLIKINSNNFPNRIILNNASINIPKPYNGPPKYNITVCISVMHHYVAVNRFIQTIETYRYFGVDHFTLYYTSSTPEIIKVINYYINLDIMDVVLWNKEFETTRLYHFYMGQIFKNNDCLYYHMKLSKSLIFTDIDEIIWPNVGNKLTDIIEKTNEIADDYIFINRIYHENVYNKSDVYDFNIKDLDIFNAKEYCSLQFGYIAKNWVYNLSSIVEIEIHSFQDVIEGMKQKAVDVSIGYVRHTRRVVKYELVPCMHSWTYDDTKDYRIDTIQENVDKIRKYLNIEKPPHRIFPLYPNTN